MKINDLVFLDLETTGFDINSDKIIEVALIYHSQEGEKVTFNHLIHPGKKLTEDIARLTGITDSMVKNAVAFSEIKDELLNILKDKVIVAHNATFDLTFLQAAVGYNLPNHYLDTLELAQILCPRMTSYSLNHLVTTLIGRREEVHRALSDAEALEKLFTFLLEEAKNLPLRTLEEIVYFLRNTREGLAIFFQDLLQDSLKNYDFTQRLTAGYGEEDREEEKKSTFSIPWDIDSLEQMFMPGGSIASAINSYQKRNQQLEMLRAVAKNFSQERFLIVEAGTGIGKTLAYLVPALTWAIAQGDKVIVATHTIALQEQILRSDIKFLKKALNFTFKAAVLKGRANYLCLYKWKAAKENSEGLSWKEKIVMARLTTWMEQDGTGDRDSVNLRQGESELFSQLASSSENCLGGDCPFYRDCFYHKSKQKAQNADLIIVNHALLLSDVKMGETILPKYQYLIVDEAHHLEEEGTKQFSESFSLRELRKTVNQMQRKRDLLKRNSIVQLFKNKIALIKENNQELAKEIQNNIISIEAVIKKINGTEQELADYYLNNQVTEHIRINNNTKNQVWWQHLETIFQNLVVQLSDLIKYLKNLYNILDTKQGEGEDSLKDIRTTLVMMEANQTLIRCFFAADQEEDKVYWMEKDGNRRDLRLNITPLKTGDLFYESLFNNKTSVVFTSATLSVNGNFKFFIEQLGLPEELVDTIKISSPFLYDEQSLLLVDTSVPEPARTREEHYNRAVKESLLTLLKVSQGGSLVLFTSHKQLRSLYEMLVNPLRQQGLELFADGVNGRRNTLINELKNNPNAIVFGANTFWEGIDLPGKSLTTLIIVKLPFLPPNLPIVEARIEEFQKEGKDGFYGYSIPQAVLRFRQGYGRLIRTIDDWGVVVLLDKRIVSKRYGKIFINSLPHNKYLAGNTLHLSEKVRSWLANFDMDK